MSYLIVLFLLSGIIAFVGNWIGRLFGKKRLSLFGLRPRNTATLFTVISGMLIMAITFTTLILVSRDVRIALFGMDKLRDQIRQSQEEIRKGISELESLNKELVSVQKEKEQISRLKEKLGREVSEQKSKTVAYKAGQVISLSVYKSGQGKEAAEKYLAELLEKLDKSIKKMNIKDVEVLKPDYESTLSYLANMQGETIVKLISTKNVISGGNVPIQFDLAPNEIVFSKDELILSSEISGKLAQNDIENKLKDLVAQVEKIARKKGIIPDLSNSVLNVPAADIYTASRRIRGYGTNTSVNIIAAKDIFTIGPLLIGIKVEI